MLEIGSRLVLLGEDEAETSERVAVRLMPLELAGSGVVFPAVHESSLSCLEHLAELELDGKTVLDIGTGSGILAIAAVKLGAYMVVATETEPFALEAAKRNAKLNDVEVVFMPAEDVDYLGEFDVVLANLGDDVGIDPTRHLGPEGELIVSLPDPGALHVLKATFLSGGSWVFTHHA